MRSWPGGHGDAKLGSNYGPTVNILKKANQRGRNQVLWLYGPDKQVTEVGTMNVFILYLNESGGKISIVSTFNPLFLNINTKVLEKVKQVTMTLYPYKVN